MYHRTTRRPGQPPCLVRLAVYLLCLAGTRRVHGQDENDPFLDGNTQAPTVVPTALQVTRSPTVAPTTRLPTQAPTVSPTAAPTVSPQPSASPSNRPTQVPSVSPSQGPTVSKAPSAVPTISLQPSISPSDVPTRLPSASPTHLPSSVPSLLPTSTPSDTPSGIPSSLPSLLPSLTPSLSSAPSGAPSVSSAPSATPSASPSASPTVSSAPSGTPSAPPSLPPPEDPGLHWAFRNFNLREPLFLIQFLVFIGFVVALTYFIYTEYKKKIAAHLAGHDVQAYNISSRALMIKIAALHMIVSEVENIFVYCGRLGVLWRRGGDYTLVRNSVTDKVAYAHLENLEFNQPSDTILRRWRCDELILDAGALLVPEESDKFLFLRLNPNAHSNGIGAFSTLVGLLIFVGLLAYSVYIEVRFEQNVERWYRKCGLPKNRLVRWLCVNSLTLLWDYGPLLLLTSHQSVVLMPLEQLQPTPYCLVVNTPPGMSAKTLIGIYILSVYGLPAGPPMMLMGAAVGWIGWQMLVNARHDRDSALYVCVVGVVAMGFAFVVFLYGLIIFGFWLLAGLFLGPWVHFGTLADMSTTVFLEFAAPSLFYLKNLIHEILGSCLPHAAALTAYLAEDVPLRRNAASGDSANPTTRDEEFNTTQMPDKNDTKESYRSPYDEDYVSGTWSPGSSSSSGGDPSDDEDGGGIEEID